MVDDFLPVDLKRWRFGVWGAGDGSGLLSSRIEILYQCMYGMK